MRTRWLAPCLGLTALAIGSEARAGCCNVVKIDAEVPVVSVRVCEADAAGGCGTLLVETELAVGGMTNVCTVEDTVVYQERPAAGGAYSPPVSAVCDGADIEI